MVADGYVVCHTLSRQVFKELLGAREELWKFGCLRKVCRGCVVMHTASSA